jgi:predicted small lipoprotein YifL
MVPETRTASKSLAATGTPVADRPSPARAQDVSKLEHQRRQRGKSPRSRTRILALTAIMAVATLLTGCGSSGPVRVLPATTVAPPAPEPAEVTATSIPVPPGTPTYLSDLREVQSFNGNEFEQGVVGVIAGQDHFRSLRTRFCKNQRQVSMYKLRQPYSTFIATMGVDDSSDPSASVQFAVIVGDDVVLQQQAGIGQAIAVNVPVLDANIVTLSATLMSANVPCRAVATWGDARVET